MEGIIRRTIVCWKDYRQKYWREVLKRIVATVKFLANLGLAFRGHREHVSSQRKGNFKTCIEYLAQFDDFLKNHLERYDNVGSGRINYLSHAIYDEFINIMGTEVKNILISEVQQALYYSIIVDSTPDVAHIDQLTFILRYVNGEGEIKERFFGFLQIEQHDSHYLENVVLETLNALSLNIKNCRGQTYDNAANMAGKYTGLQARIKMLNESATFIPCSSHTLNLVGNCAAEACSAAVYYFDFLQNIYVFFSASTKRWNRLINNFSNSKSKHIQKICDTRWSARADAVSALRLNYKNIKNVLIAISTDDDERPITKLEAKKLAKYFDEYEIALLTVLWDKLLQRINSTSHALQKVETNLWQCMNLLHSLCQFLWKSEIISKLLNRKLIC